MELTKKQNKAFEILARGIKRKYPFIKGLILDEEGEADLVIFVKVIVDYDKFFEYADEKPKKEEYWDRETLKDFYDRYRFSTLIPLIDNREKYGYKFTEKIADDLNNIYKGLPDDYKINFKPKWSDNFYTVKISTVEFKIELE